MMEKPSDPRRLALDILLACHHSRTTLDAALENFAPSMMSLSRQDKGLCHALIFGVLRRRGFLDHLIAHFSNKPLEKIDIHVIYLLRMALFQLTCLDRIPDFAVINTTVDIAKKCRAKKAAGFINAVLRKAAVNHKTIPIPGTKDSIPHLAIQYSLPQWLMKRWLDAYGMEDVKQICESISQIPPTILRTNTLKINREHLIDLLDEKHISHQPGNTPEAIILNQPGIPVSELPGFLEGYFQVQDQAAQMVSHYLAPRPGERILDACAGLGGKSFHMAQLMENQGQIIAMDVSSGKLKRLKDESHRLGIHMVDTICEDVRNVTSKDFPDFFDRVLVDAPCTGLGVLRRNPDSRWKRSIKQIQNMAARQKKILNAAANLVRPGGILVFVVCSCEKEETHNVADGFLAKRKDFTADMTMDQENYWAALIQQPGRFATWPHALDMDGFFAARFRRTAKGPLGMGTTRLTHNKE